MIYQFLLSAFIADYIVHNCFFASVFVIVVMAFLCALYLHTAKKDSLKNCLVLMAIISLLAILFLLVSAKAQEIEEDPLVIEGITEYDFSVEYR